VSTGSGDAPLPPRERERGRRAGILSGRRGGSSWSRELAAGAARGGDRERLDARCGGGGGYGRPAIAALKADSW